MSSPQLRTRSSFSSSGVVVGGGGNGISYEAGAKIIRWGVAAIALVVCARQGLLAFSASVNISLSDGLLLMDMDESLPTTKSCNNTPIAGSLMAMSQQSVLLEKEKEIKSSSTKNRLASSSAFDNIDEEETSSSCTDYHAYPVPDHHSGLPYLADVFATRDRQYLFFIGLNRGICSNEFEKQDGWMDGEYRFMCIFPDKTAVISEYVAPTGKIYRNNYMFRCKIPKEFQHMVVPGQQSTKLHVDLHSLHNPEGKKIGMNKVPWFDSQKVTDTPKIHQIPVCHAGHADLGDKRYELAAYTRVQSNYKTQVDKFGKSEQRSTIHRIEEWIDWHVSQGFDHFIIYDNDPQPHGPIEELTKPHVESGLVTYRWFPLKDCVVQSDGKKVAKRKTFGKRPGNIKRIGQAAGGLSAMHRLDQTGALYFAHMDVDEFFVIYEDGVTVLDYIKKELTPESKKDVFLWKPTVLDYCDGTNVESEADSPMETKQCWTKNHASDQKLIMRTETMLHFQVHFPLTTRRWTKPKAYLVPTDPETDEGVGFLAHYRGEVSGGCKMTGKTSRLPYFDKFIAERRKRKGLPPLEQKAKCTTPQDGGDEGANNGAQDDANNKGEEEGGGGDEEEKQNPEEENANEEEGEDDESENDGEEETTKGGEEDEEAEEGEEADQ